MPKAESTTQARSPSQAPRQTQCIQSITQGKRNAPSSSSGRNSLRKAAVFFFGLLYLGSASKPRRRRAFNRIGEFVSLFLRVSSKDSS